MHRHRDGSRRLTPLLLPSRPRYITQVHMHTKAWQVVREAAASDWKFCIPSGPFLPAPASRMYDKCGRLTSDHGDYLYLGIDEVRDVAMSWFDVRMLVRLGKAGEANCMRSRTFLRMMTVSQPSS